jgi:CSLREA domain-containing protein
MSAKHAAFMLICIGIILALASPAAAAVINVTTFTDEDGTGADCSLREAVTAANTDMAYGGCPAGGSADTIVLPDGVYTLTAGSQLVISSSVTIQPAATSATVRAAAAPDTVARRVFQVNSSGALALENLIITNGGQLFWADSGGCISVSGGALTLTSTIVRSCNVGFEGGAIFSDGGTVTISGGAIHSNRALDDGGGLRLLNSSLSITGADIHSNTTNGVFSAAAIGGGVAFEGNSFTLDGVAVYNNVVNDLDGGSALGGGLAVRMITAGSAGTITNSRIEANSITGTAAVQGGAIYKFGSGSLTVSNTCIVGNSSPAVHNVNTVPLTARGSWWGTAWGPRILGATAGSGSLVSSGDSINGTGFTPVVVDGTPALSYGTEDGTPPPTGDWLTTAPTGCRVCTTVSTLDPAARVCV